MWQNSKSLTGKGPDKSSAALKKCQSFTAAAFKSADLTTDSVNASSDMSYPVASSTMAVIEPSKSENCTPKDPKTPIRPSTSHGSDPKMTPMRGEMGTPSGTHRFFSRNSGVHKTPNSGPRINPFDSHASHDTLHLPTFSPSVFSTVISPSQESHTSSGRFWSVDQQALLFPAQISDDSPWKQEIATSRLDPEVEDKTQEAIDIYFSQHHKVTSPVEVPRNMAANDRSFLGMDESQLGGSPDLSKSKLSRRDMAMSISQPTSPVKSQEEKAFAKSASCDNSRQNMTVSTFNVSRGSTDEHPAGRMTNRWTQTELSFPTDLPPEVEEMLSRYTTFTGTQVNSSPVISSNFHMPAGATSKQHTLLRTVSRIPLISSSAAGSMNNLLVVQDQEANNLSSSTLRRKLFDEMMDDDEDEIKGASDSDKENDDRPQILVSPGAVMLTPSANPSRFSPGHGLTWSLSPVSRKKKPQGQLGPPMESSTPTKD